MEASKDIKVNYVHEADASKVFGIQEALKMAVAASRSNITSSN